MRNEQIYITRAKRFLSQLKVLRYSNPIQMECAYIYDEKNPIPYSEAIAREFKPISIGEIWGDTWGCGWFKMKVNVPKSFKGKQVGAQINVGGEACIFVHGSPVQGLTNKSPWDMDCAKTFYPLIDVANGNEKVELILEVGANGLFGKGQKEYRLLQAEIVIANADMIHLYYDIYVLLDLASKLDKKVPRRKKIIYGLNEIMNHWQEGKGLDFALKYTRKLLQAPAHYSSLTAFSVGHAHLDLAWLWPIRETRRKGGRTFATALQLLDTYPEYRFGASQPQLYEWIKQDYPALYNKVKRAVKEKRWECQGAMWCEPDMNLVGGEALVRQCLYGKQFFREEFSIEVDHLWLPDVFGYSAALPQILKKADINSFMTQKISWNETNTFPHHTFMWQGIDGTEILTHFLPTNDYNLSNKPSLLIESEERYAQADVSDEFLNLYGIGDGGGGPSRMHIELGLRQQNLEGTPKFKFAFANEFFEKIKSIPKKKLPKWVGELYLELHRGTYTTQAKIKKNNRELEQQLRKLEFLNTIVQVDLKDELDQIWKDTLLNQFQDILPGSSIQWVYQDANALAKKCLEKIDELKKMLIHKIFCKGSASYIVFNANSWERKQIISMEKQLGVYTVFLQDTTFEVQVNDGKIEFEIDVPACGYTIFKIEKTDKFPQLTTSNNYADIDVLENDLIRVKFDYDGTIGSIYDKESKRETLDGRANLIQLWEDKPNNWGAWDVNHYYRETIPEKAVLHSKKFGDCSALKKERIQYLKVGRSSIVQTISIQKNSKQILFKTKVDWKEAHKMLRVSAKPNILTDTVTCEIQYGNLKRATHENTSWDMAKFEICAHRFVDLSQPDYGFSVINDCKYGYFVRGNEIDLNLLRSPKDVDEEADLHTHYFTYGYYPHIGSFENADTLKVAHDLNSPMEMFSIQAEKPVQESFFKVSNDRVKIETMKISEDKTAIILRLYETKGSKVEIDLASKIHTDFIEEVNLLERSQNKYIKKSTRSTHDFGIYKLTFNPYEIRTFKIKK